MQLSWKDPNATELGLVCEISTIDFENDSISRDSVEISGLQYRRILESPGNWHLQPQSLQEVEALGSGQEAPARSARPLEERPFLFDHGPGPIADVTAISRTQS